MRNIQGLPLADPPSDSLGRLNGQCPGLFYVACANNVGVVCVATSRANKLRLASTAGRIHNPAFGAPLRRVRRIDELMTHVRDRVEARELLRPFHAAEPLRFFVVFYRKSRETRAALNDIERASALAGEVVRRMQRGLPGLTRKEWW